MTAKELFLFDIFSYSCMNCLRSLDYIKKIDNKYKKYGLKTILIHPPEWDFEKNSNNIIRAAKKYKIKMPIIIDKNKKIIKKLKIDFWPTQALIRNNKVLYKHIGEGSYKRLEGKIMKALKIKSNAVFNNEPKYKKLPTVYAGKRKKGKISELKGKLKLGIIYKKGAWKQNEESLTGKGSLAIKTKGKIVSMVASSINKKTIKINIKLDNKTNKNISINEPQLYDIIKLKNNKSKILELSTKSKIAVYSFAFR